MTGNSRAAICFEASSQKRKRQEDMSKGAWEAFVNFELPIRLYAAHMLLGEETTSFEAQRLVERDSQGRVDQYIKSAGEIPSRELARSVWQIQVELENATKLIQESTNFRPFTIPEYYGLLRFMEERGEVSKIEKCLVFVNSNEPEPQLWHLNQGAIKWLTSRSFVSDRLLVLREKVELEIA